MTIVFTLASQTGNSGFDLDFKQERYYFNHAKNKLYHTIHNEEEIILKLHKEPMEPTAVTVDCSMDSQENFIMNLEIYELQEMGYQRFGFSSTIVRYEQVDVRLEIDLNVVKALQ